MDKAGQVSVFARRTPEGSRTDTMGLRSGGDKLAEEAYEDVERTIRWSNPVRQVPNRGTDQTKATG